MDEKRRILRHRTLKGGMISFHHAAAGIDCVVRNLSDAGACLDVESPVGIPNTFTLLIKPEGRTQSCEVIWRKAKRIGVRFVPE